MVSRPTLLTLYLLSPNKLIRRKTKYAMKLAREVLGKPTFTDKLKSSVLFLSAIIEGIKYSFWKILGRETIIYQPKNRKIEYNLESQTVHAIVKNQINEWVRLNKTYLWVQNQLKSIPSKETLLKKVSQISNIKNNNLSIVKMQNIWRQIFSNPKILQKYWKSAGGKEILSNTS